MISYTDLQIAIVSINQCLRSLRCHWEKQDKLYTEYFYTEHELTRLLHQDGSLDDYQLKATWRDIDAQMEEYDDDALNRFVVEKHLQETASRFREEIRQQKGEKK